MKNTLLSLCSSIAMIVLVTLAVGAMSGCGSSDQPAGAPIPTPPAKDHGHTH